MPLVAEDGGLADGVLYRPVARRPVTCLALMHPSISFHHHYAAIPLADRGWAVACVNSRYAGMDSQLVMERAAMDLAAGVRRLRQIGFERVVLLGNSGGGALSAFYQAGSPDGAAADALIVLNAHRGRAEVLTDWLDASVTDETDPHSLNPDLDLFDRAHGPPYGPAFVSRYRDAQLARNRRITAWCQEQLAAGSDRAFVVHRTTADPRFLDLSLDPSDRDAGCYWGLDVRAANYGVPGLARWSSCRSWLSQWAIDTSAAAAEPSLAGVKVPTLFIQGTADQGIFPSDVQRMHEAAGAGDKELHWIRGGSHYFAGQPECQRQVFDLVDTWLRSRGLGE